MPELQDIFREFGPAYRAGYKLPLRHLKAMHAIESCRTAELGGHLDRCEACGHLRVSYNSCRNRHCPKCQGAAGEKWLAARMEDLLPVLYFHVVFTLPDLLNPLALRNQREVYALLFRAASETLLELAGDPRHLGAKIGLTAVLHTWGQNLLDHPHLHCLVPGGGISPDGLYWRQSRREFFIPVRVLSRKFRGKFLALLKEAYREGKLTFPGAIANLETSFPQLLDRLYRMEWVVYCKKPFAGPEYVLRYLCLYTHRVAISNSRIVSLEDGKVTFRWRDYRDGRKTKLMTLTAPEFIRRFLLHILPERFVKIRYFGILSNRTRRVNVKLCRWLTGWRFWRNAALPPERTGADPWLCPRCGKGKMIVTRWFDSKSLSPPIVGKTV